MNNLNDNARGTFIHIQTLVGDIITSDRRIESLTGVYVSGNGDGKTSDFNACLGGRNLEFTLLLTCAGRYPNSTSGVITQDVSVGM